MVSKVISREAKVITRVDTNVIIRKAELLWQVKNLIETNDALEINNRKKI